MDFECTILYIRGKNYIYIYIEYIEYDALPFTNDSVKLHVFIKENNDQLKVEKIPMTS